MRGQNLRMPICRAIRAVPRQDESRQRCVRWEAWKSPGQYCAGGVGEQRLLSECSTSEAC